jgi:regulator of nonsense transcripts 2
MMGDNNASDSVANVIDQDFEAQIEALSQLDQLKHERDDLIKERQSNSFSEVVAYRKLNETKKSALKSDLKKTMAYVKKLRAVNVEGLQQCIRDTETLNLTLYISEICQAISETAFKATDVPTMVKLCVALHRRYEEFTLRLISLIQSALIFNISEEDKEAGKRKRILIRFAIELFQAGVWTEDNFFVDLLRHLVGKGKG